MEHKFVVRLLDAEDRLLGWAAVFASPNPGGLWVPRDPVTNMFVDQDGFPSKVSIEWTDLCIARVYPFMGTMDEVKAGQTLAINHIIFPIWIVEGDPNAPVPPVTERRHVTLAPPSGNLGAIGHR